MNYLLVNASPRGKGSNSGLLIDHFIEGMQSSSLNNNHEILDLRYSLADKSWQQALNKAQSIIVFFPLYTDHVPGILKHWIEDLGPGALAGKNIGWFAQCGFPESIHLEWTEKYLNRVTELLGAGTLGVVKQGGVEATRLFPSFINAKLYKNVQKIGASVAAEGMFDKKVIQSMANPRCFNLITRLLFRLFGFKMFNMYWNIHLKKNRAYKIRFDAPYRPE